MFYEEIASNLSKEKIISLLKFQEENKDIQELFQKELSKVKTELDKTNQLILWFKKQVFGKKSEKRIYESDTLPLNATPVPLLPKVFL